MAIKQGLAIQMPEVFVTMAVFILAYGTMLAASHKSKHTDEKAEFDAWYKSLSSDPKHPWYKQPLPPQPHDRFYLYAKYCLDDIDDKKCVKQIFDGIFDKAKVEVKCGCKIKKMGRMCMMAVAGTTGHMKKYEAEADSIYKRANRILDNSDKLSKCPKK
ncbi:hypothetical protein C3L33_18987, partial [Rhododendron williamsianum]